MIIIRETLAAVEDEIKRYWVHVFRKDLFLQDRRLKVKEG